MGKKILIGIGIFIIALSGYRVAKFIQGRRVKDVLSGTIPVTIKVSRVEKKDIEEVLSLTGDLHGMDEVKVYADVGGKLAEKIKGEGDRVKKGEAIALIDRDEPAMDFAMARVKSPIAGTLIRYFCDLGETVLPARSMGKPIAMVADMVNMRAVINIGEKDIPLVKKGQKARIWVDSYPDKSFAGRVKKIAPAVDPLSRKLKIEIEIANESYNLKPGMFSRVDIIVKTHKNVLVVPKKAVIERDDKLVTFRIVRVGPAIIKGGMKAGGEIVLMCQVETGAVNDEVVEIKKGLEEGDLVVVEGNYGLTDGAEVETE